MISEDDSYVLLDLIMPNKSGIELLPKIITCHPHDPVFMAAAIHGLKNCGIY